MAVDVKLGVSGLATFKQNLKDAQSAVDALDAAMGLNAATLKNVGDQEAYVNTQAYLLTQQIEAQERVVGTLQQALVAMKNSGVDESSSAFQKLKEQSYEAQTKLMDMQTELKNVGDKGKDAASGLGKTDKAVDDINKNTAWANVSKGINDITDKLERGAKAAINFGKKLASNFKDSADWADDLEKMSNQTGLSVEELQKMDKVAEILNTDVEAIVNAQTKMKKAAATGAAGRKTLVETLGIDLDGTNAQDLFWEIGEKLMNMGDEFDKEGAAAKVFGAKWADLIPIFQMGREEFEKLMSGQSFLTEDQVKKLSEAGDKMTEVEQQIAELKNKFWSDNAENITKLLQWLIDNKDAVVGAVTAMAGAFGMLKLAGLGADLAKTINAFKTLLPGTSAGAGAAGGGTAGGGTGGGWLSGLLGKAWGGTKAFFSANGASAFAPLAALFAGTMPAIMANNADYARIEEKTQQRLTAATKMGNSLDASWLEQAALALGLKRDANGNLEKNFLGQYVLQGNEQNVYDLLMGLGDRSDLQRAQLHNLLNGSYSTWNQNAAWNELQALWGGSGDFDQGRLNGLLDAIVNAYEDRISRMEQQETQKGQESNTQNTLTSADLAAFTGLPGQIAQAVRSGISGITITISQGAVDTIGQRNGQTMWQNIINKITGG